MPLENQTDLTSPGHTCTRPDMGPEGGALPVTLLEILSNTLILHQTCPYLPVSALLALAATSTSFRHLIFKTPHVFRYLDLSTVKADVSFAPIDAGGEVWRNERMDESVTEGKANIYWTEAVDLLFTVLQMTFIVGPSEASSQH